MFSKDGYIGNAIAAYNPRGRSAGGIARVATMAITLLVRTIQLCVYIARSAINGRTTSLIVGCIFGILGTFFIALCLGRLGAAQGKRRALGMNWGRLHFDAVLGFAAVASVALMVVTFITSGSTRNAGLFTAWCVVWVIISLATWIADKPATMATNTSYA